MRKRAFILLIFVTALRSISASAESIDDQLVRAAALNDQGTFREAIQTIAPLLGRKMDANDGGRTGIAWNIDGIARQNLGDLEKALHSYETALEILRRTPTQVKQYAAALDNLGSLKAEMGQLDESQSLRMHARKLYEAMEYHADANALRASGQKAEAERIEVEARRGLASFQHPCGKCSISASSFR
ncbi:MAG TPA: tetratricopeptide repeat protein [Terracidiphilus sp.]|jgi:tetratricopeptide (TPR) repeat protein